MSEARGTFTVWYMQRTTGKDSFKHGIRASSRADLMTQAENHCPRGYYVRAIAWQHGGGTKQLWYKIDGKTVEQCWDNKDCKRAFGE